MEDYSHYICTHNISLSFVATKFTLGAFRPYCACLNPSISLITQFVDIYKPSYTRCLYIICFKVFIAAFNGTRLKRPS